MLASTKQIGRSCASSFKLHSHISPYRKARIPVKSGLAIRTMASSSSEKREWLFILPDKPGTLEKRMEIRQKHLNNVKPHVENGGVLLGGPLLEEHASDGQPMKIQGSAMVTTAATVEEAIEFLKNDIYTTSGVWDWDNAQIFPFKSVVGRGV